MRTNTYVKTALVLGLIASIYYIWHWFLNPAIVNDTNYSAAIAIVWPHLAATWLATATTFACLFWEKKGLLLLSAGLYGLAVALIPDYMMFVIIQAALMFTAYLRFDTIEPEN
ncbi:hypothetical protein ACTQ45_07640 [Fundicoccus sp. Sow4_D5]|uniref:hypothetical protein n=1 Tax=unclassified Fundicoccus TaxID=2761543 RepID=UPI003F937872